MKELFEFGSFRLEAGRRRLLRGQDVLPITSKVFETLLVLVRNHDRVLTKDELMQAVWPDTIVEEVNLAQNVSALRKLLGEAPGDNRYIATIPGRGYRFVENVRVLPADDEEIVVQRQTTTTVVVEDEQEVEDAEALAAQPALPAARRRFLGLGKLAWAGIALLVVIAAAGWYLGRGRRSVAAAPPRSLAVLPFQSLGAGDDEYLGLGLTDAAITRLSAVRQLVVRPTSSVLRFAGTKTDPIEAGRQLRVDSVLDGKVQRAGDRIRVTVQMISVPDGRPLWAETFDENFTNAFNVEDSISQRVVDTLSLQLAGQDKKQLARNYTENIEAYQNYVKGRYEEFRFTPDGLQKAIAYFQRAIQLDPGYALAYAGLADAYTTASDWVLPPREALPKAEAAARKALVFDPNLAEAHAALAHSLMHQWKLDDAGKEFQRALELNPNNTAFYFTYAEYFSALGEEDRALAELDKAIKLDPLSPEINSFYAWVYYLKRDYNKALEACLRTSKIDPNYFIAYWGAGFSYMMNGQYPQAIEQLQKALAMDPTHAPSLRSLAMAYIRSGDRASGVKVLEQMKKLSASVYISPIDLSLVYAELGDMDQSYAWFKKGYEDESEEIIFFHVEPVFDTVRHDPRFTELVRKAGETSN